MPDGLKITLSGLGDGLTRDGHGKELLPQPFVFQCPPMDEFKITRAFNFGNYDTIASGQFSRWGSRQLMTWSFDTLVMYLAVDNHNSNEAFRRAKEAAVALRIAQQSHNSSAIASAQLQFQLAYSEYQQDARTQRHGISVKPSWVPFPDPTSLTRHYDPKYTPEWYRTQLWSLHDSGAPFRFVAHFSGADIGPVLRTYATLTGFSEGYKAGEGDAIYLEGVSFQEWRDPSMRQHGHKKQGSMLPATVLLRADNSPQRFGAYAPGGLRVPAHGPSTLAQLARHYYHEPSRWKLIAKANSVKHGNANTPLQKLYPFSKTNFKHGQVRFLIVPQVPSAHHHHRHHGKGHK